MDHADLKGAPGRGPALDNYTVKQSADWTSGALAMQADSAGAWLWVSKDDFVIDAVRKVSLSRTPS